MPPASEAAGRTRPRSRPRRRLFALTTRLTTREFVRVAALVFAAIAFLWWAVTAAGLVRPLFLPSPAMVLARLADLASGGQLAADMAVSVYRIMLGFLISTAFAVPIGVLIGSYRAWEAAIEPFVDFIRYMPVVAFVPLTILWTGTGDAQKFLIIWIGTFFQQVLLVMDNVKSVPTDFVNVGRTLEMSEPKILTRIILPSAMPGIWDSLRISLGWAWTWLVVAELVAATSGLGYRITTAQRFFQTDTIFGYLLVLGILGLTTDQAMKAIGRRLFRYLAVRR
ncbi:ABC transporter permease [Labrys wisconsinensis]|uniref:NitT/TauT family transport system permease protein n=1 Tax=Labrys wisconsinensis TaxID=425677 RepID=A0ABU0J0T7_9HYPH|nr:ABC transporter permease [Labrys wisconsinensis]MDQ0467876.1 NitT/TauT family transport system permease protein [Labrys wisconsinensis]